MGTPPCALMPFIPSGSWPWYDSGHVALHLQACFSDSTTKRGDPRDPLGSEDVWVLPPIGLYFSGGGRPRTLLIQALSLDLELSS